MLRSCELGKFDVFVSYFINPVMHAFSKHVLSVEHVPEFCWVFKVKNSIKDHIISKRDIDNYTNSYQK